MNDIDKMPSKCRDCPYWELAAEPYVCSDCTTPVKKCGGDYILRSDALKELYRDASATDPMIMIAYRVDIYERLESIPAADVEPVRHGKWVPGKEISRTMLGNEVLAIEYKDFYCSSCKRRYKEYVLKYKRCPECGAKMMSDDEIADGIGQTFSPD